eukprot:5398695-Pyramimonas_sp.AAC.1
MEQARAPRHEPAPSAQFAGGRGGTSSSCHAPAPRGGHAEAAWVRGSGQGPPRGTRHQLLDRAAELVRATSVTPDVVGTS